MCFSVIFTPNWVWVTSCKIKPPGNGCLRILHGHVPKWGPQWQGAKVPKTSLFLIVLLVFPASHLVFSAPHLFFPNGAKMYPKMIPGGPIIRVFRSKTATQICATTGTAFTLNACFLLAACLLPASLLASCFLAACFLAVCFLACLLACCLLASNSTVAGLASATGYIYIYI